MLATKGINLKGTETFEEAFDLIPNNDVEIRYLVTEAGEDTGVYQLYNSEKKIWTSPRKTKVNKEGQIELVDTNTKHKLSNAKVFYDCFTRPTNVGTDTSASVGASWLIGDIDDCEIMGEDYNVQGLLISSIFDPMPKFYISFNRLVCENQFGTLGKNSSSMYINMNAFLKQAYSLEAKEKLEQIIKTEILSRIDEQQGIYAKLCSIKVSEEKMHIMFEKLTVDKVAKNSPLREAEEKRLANYISAYNVEDNQNYKGTLFGFVNAYTRINTRENTNPFGVIKPVINSNILNTPCDFDFLCREAVINANSVAVA